MLSTRVEIRELDQAVRFDLPDSEAQRVLAALAADPLSISELNAALSRFHPPSTPASLLPQSMRDPSSPNGTGAELCIDLQARAILGRNLRFGLTQEGHVPCQTADGRETYPFRYHLAPDWRTIASLHKFEATCQLNRNARRKHPMIDDRAVLWGPELCQFLVQQLRGQRVQLSQGGSRRRRVLHADIHRRWLMSPLESLKGECPRDRLINDRHRHISKDVEDQMRRWSVLRFPPPAIPEDSEAYRFAGFGLQEFILYYDLIRSLIDQYTRRIVRRRGSLRRVTRDVTWMENLVESWWKEPSEDHGDAIPLEIAHAERSRLPFVTTPNFSCECAMCQAMKVEQAINGSPSFFFLDTYHVDDEFEFSQAQTPDDWEPFSEDDLDGIVDGGMPRGFGPTIIQPVMSADDDRDASDQPDDSPFGGQTVHVTMPINQERIKQRVANERANRNEPFFESADETAFLLGWIDDFLTQLTSGLEAFPEISLRLRGCYQRLQRSLEDEEENLSLEQTEFPDAFQQLLELRPDMKPKCDGLRRLIEMVLERRRKGGSPRDGG